jgi:hypothetical protein
MIETLRGQAESAVDATQLVRSFGRSPRLGNRSAVNDADQPATGGLWRRARASACSTSVFGHFSLWRRR